MMRRKQLSVLLTVLILTMTVTASGCGAKKEDAVILPDTEEVMAVVDTETETEEPTETVEATEKVTEATEAVEETEVMESTEAQTAEADADGYTYETLDQTMYAKNQVNVRNKPSQDGEKLGALKANEETKVTGRCKETGWYRISYAGNTGYVSDKYLTDTKASTQASKGTTKNTNSSAGKNSASTGTASGTGNGSTSGTTASNGSNNGSSTPAQTPAQTPDNNGGGGNSTPSTPDSGNGGGNQTADNGSTTPSTPDSGNTGTGKLDEMVDSGGLPPMPEGPTPDYSGDDSNLVMGGGTFEIN